MSMKRETNSYDRKRHRKYAMRMTGKGNKRVTNDLYWKRKYAKIQRNTEIDQVELPDKCTPP